MCARLLVALVVGRARAGLWPAFESDFARGAPRFWPKHVGTRTATLLDGTWGYGFDPALADSLAAGPEAVRRTATMAVPACVDAAPPGVARARGASAYETTFATRGDAAYLSGVF